MLNKKRIVIIGIVFLISLVVFSSFLNNSNALQNDNDLSVTLHGQLISNSAEVSSELMPVGTYTYFEDPELSVGEFNHDISHFEIENIQYSNQSNIGMMDYEITKGVNDTEGNHSLSFNDIPYYELDAPFDTFIILDENYTVSNYINYSNAPYGKSLLLQETFDSNMWRLVGTTPTMSISSNLTQDAYVDIYYPDTNYGSSSMLYSNGGYESGLLLDDTIDSYNWLLYGGTKRNIIINDYISEDSYVNSYLPTTNYGNSGELVVGRFMYMTSPYYYDIYLKNEMSFPYFTQNVTGSKLHTYFLSGVNGDVKLYNTTTFNEGTITWNSRPSAGALITTYWSCPNTGWVIFNLNFYNPYILITKYDDYVVFNKHISSSEGSSSYMPYITYTISKEYQGGGYKYIQTNETETLQMRSPVYPSSMNLVSGDFLNFSFQTTSNKEIKVRLLNGGSQVDELVLLSAGNTNFNNQTKQVFISKTLTFDQVEIVGEFDDAKYFKLYDMKVYSQTSAQTKNSYIGAPNRLSNYLTDNKTANSLLYFFLVNASSGTHYIYATSSYNEGTITWNNKPVPTTGIIGTFTGGYTGYKYFDLGNIYYDYFVVKPLFDSSLNFSSSESISNNPYIIDYYSKIYQGSGSIYAQTNINGDMLTLQSPIYAPITLINGDFLSIDIKPKCNDALNVSLILNGIVQKTIQIIAEGNTNENQRLINLTLNTDVSFNEIKVYGTLENAEYFRLYDIKVYSYVRGDFVKNVHIENFNYQILGVDYYENYTLPKDSANYDEEIGNYSFHFDSTMFSQYDYTHDVVIPNQNLTIVIELAFTLDTTVYFFMNVSYSTGVWRVPSDINFQVNGEDVSDETYNSGYVFLDTFPNTVAFTTTLPAFFKFNSTTDFTFTFDLDVISRTHLEKEFELLSDHLVYINRIDFSDNLDIKWMSLNNIPLGSSNPTIINPAYSMNTGNKYTLMLILAEDIYIPLDYYYNDLGIGTSHLYISGLTNKYSFSAVSKYSGLSVVLPNSFFPVYADLNFSNIEYQEYYVSNFSNNVNSYNYESTPTTEEDVDWSFDYNLTSENGTKDGESGGSGYKDVYYQYFDSITGDMTHIYFPAYNSTYTVSGQLVENDILPKEFRQEAWDSWSLTYNSTCTTSSFASGTLISQLNNYQNAYSPITGQFTMLNGTKVAFGSLSSIDGAYVNLRSTQQSSSNSPTTSQFSMANGTKVSYGDLTTLNGVYTNLKSNQQTTSNSPTTGQFSMINGTKVSYGDLTSMNGVYTNLRSNYQSSSTVPATDSYTFLNGSKVSDGDLWTVNGAYSDFRSKAGSSGVSTDTGYLTAGSTDGTLDSPDGSGNWLDPDNAKTSNNQYAYISMNRFVTSGYLKMYNFGANIPVGSTINGIEVQIEHKAETTTSIYDGDVKLVRDGTVEGNDKASASVWGASDETWTYGASNDLWGLTWTSAQVNSVNTGVVLSAGQVKVGTWIAYVDMIKIKIYYTPVGKIATLNFTSTLQLNKPRDSQIESVRLNYAQKINTTITAGIRTMYLWNYGTSGWDSVNTTISTANYYEMIYSLTSSYYSSGQTKIKWIITRTDSIDAFSLYIDKMVLRYNYSCVLNFTSTFQLTKPKDSLIDSVKLNYAQKTNLTCTTKTMYIWDFVGSVWDTVNSTISASNYYEMVHSLESSQYNSTNHIKLKWVLYRGTSLMTSQTMFSLYIDKLVARMNFSCVLNFTSTFQLTKPSTSRIDSVRLNYAQKTNLTCTSKIMYIWDFVGGVWDTVNSTISATNYYEMIHTLESSQYNSTYHIKLKWVLYRGTSLMTSQTMFSLYIDKLVFMMNFSCVLNFTSTFQFSKMPIDSITWARLNYGQKTNLTCTSKAMYIWNYGRSGWDVVNTTISPTNFYDIVFNLNSSHYDSACNIILKWVLYRGANLMTSQTMFSLYIDKLVLTVNTTRTGGSPYASNKKTINYSFLNYFDTNYNYLKTYNITIKFRYKYTNYTSYTRKAYFNKDTTINTLQVDAVWRYYSYSFQFDSASLSSFDITFNITNGKLELTNMNYTMIFCCLNTTSRTILYQYYKLDPVLSLSYLQATRGIWYLNFSMVFTKSNFNVKYWNKLNYSQLMYRIAITTESGIIYYSFDTNNSLTQSVSVNLTQVMKNNGKTQIWDFYIEFYLSGNNSRLVIDNLHLWNYDHDFYDVYAVWISDDLVYVGQTITVYWLASDEYPKCVVFTQKIDGLSLKQIYNITLLNNTFQSQDITNYTAGVCDLNLTFYDEFDNWQRWNITYIIHATVSVSTAYKNPIYTVHTENVSVYIKSDSLIQSIHYDNSTAYLLKSASYPISYIEFNISLYFVVATVYNISVNVLTTYGDHFRCNISNLCALESIARIDIFNLLSRYYQDNTMNVSALLLDYGNNPIYEVIQYNIVDPDGVVVQNGGILGNVGTITLGFDVSYDVGFYHLNASFSGANTYTDGWKYMSFELNPIMQYFTNGTGISLSVNGASITGDSARVFGTSTFVLDHLNNASFDLDITFELYLYENISYNEYLDYSFTFQASSQFIELTIDNASLIDSPTNFSSYYFYNLLSTNYILTGTTLTISDLSGVILVDGYEFEFSLRYAQYSKKSSQITVNPTTEDTSVVFEEYLYANRSFSYWYFVNSLGMNDVELEHIRTGATISTFTQNGSMYYFTESSLSGDQFTATVDYVPNWNISFTILNNTGIYTKIQVRYKSGLTISNVSTILDLSSYYCYNERWTVGASQNENSLKLIIPSVNFTTSYQSIIVEGYSDVPYANITSYATVYPGSRIIIGEVVEFAGYLEYTKYTNVFTLAVSSRWNCYDVHYGNDNRSIGVNSLSDSLLYVSGYGFNPSVNDTFLHFSTRPFTKVDWQYDDATDTITITINSLLPVSDVYFLYAWDPAEQHSLVVHQSPSELIDLSDSGDYDGYLFFGMDVIEAGETVIKIYVNYVTPMEMLVQFVIVAAVLGIGIGLFYYFKYDDNARNKLEKFLNKQIVERLEKLKGEEKGLESVVLSTKDNKLIIKPEK